MNDVLKVDCPLCGAKVGKSCRALTSGCTTDIHVGRIDAYWNRPKDQLTPEALLLRAIFGEDA